MSETSYRKPHELRRSIETLVAEADDSLHAQSVEEAGTRVSPDDLEKYARDLDLAISEEALVTLRAQFLRFSSVFDTAQSRDMVREAVADVVKPLLQTWIENNMPDIAREVITDAISQIADHKMSS
jgi:cell pole-organizing protein PopZ